MMSLTGISIVDGIVPLFWQLMFGCTVLLTIAAAAVTVSRRSSAAVRHRLWSLGVLGVLVFPTTLPALPAFAPAWWQPVGTQRRAEPEEGSGHRSALRPPFAASKSVAPPVAIIAEHDQQVTDTVLTPAADAALRIQSSSERTMTPVALAPATTVQPAPATTRQRSIEWLPAAARAVVVVWLIGVGLSLAGWLVVMLRARSFVRRSTPLRDGRTGRIAVQLVEAIGLRAAPRILCSPHTRVPLTAGWRRPVVILTSDVGDWNAARVRVSLAHELSHIARRDVLWQSLARLACALYWPHPLAWVAAWRMRVEREHACDDAVLRLGEQPAEYATHLVDVASVLRQSSRRPPVTVAMASRSAVEQRVVSILKAGVPRTPVGRGLGVLLLTGTALAIVAAGVLRPAIGEAVKTDSIRAEAGRSADVEFPNANEETAAGEPGTQTAGAGAAISEEPARAVTSTKPEPAVPHSELTGLVVDESGHAVAGAAVESQYRTGTATATTDDSGRFTISVPTQRLNGLNVVASTADGQQMAIEQIPWDTPVDARPTLKLTMKPARRAEAQVVDGEARPVAGANVTFQVNHNCLLSKITDEQGAAVIMLPVDAQVQSLHAWKHGLGLDYKAYQDQRKLATGEPQTPPDFSQPIRLVLSGARPLTVTLRDADTDLPISDTPVYVWLFQKPGEPDQLNVSYFVDDFRVTTDEHGRATLDWIPQWEASRALYVWANNRDYDRQRGEYKLAGGDGLLTMRLHKLVPISGRVTFPDGSPAPDIKLQVAGAGYAPDDFRGTAQTDADGRYEIKVSPHQVYLLIVDDKQWAAPPATGFAILPGQPKENVDFRLRPATRLFGRVTLGSADRPVAGQRIDSYQDGISLHEMQGVTLPNPTDSHTWVQPHYVHTAMSDEEGRFEMFVGPGQYDLRGPKQNEIERFEITTETEREFNFRVFRKIRGSNVGREVAFWEAWQGR